ncbi:MAG: Zn-dependent exopeptidase [Conexibacter sp.]|nr:Zn-dependent exopeptidase [Conexibacter sp.]
MTDVDAHGDTTDHVPGEPPAGPAGRPPPPPEEGGRLSVKLLVVALVVQLVLFGGLIVMTVHGFPFLGGGDHVATRAPTKPGAVPRASVNRFDGARAMATAKMQVDAGQRPAGSPTLRRVAEKLRAELPGGRFETVPGLGPGRPLRNIVGELPGPGPVIVIGAHYDSEYHPKGFVGANDAAAAVGTVIELSRALAKLPRTAVSPGIRFVLFDGEEEAAPTDDFYRDALRGSKSYVQIHAEEVRAMLLLDYIGNKGVRLPREASSTASLWDDVRAAAKRVNVADAFPSGTSVGILDDHTPFLRAGIPAVDFIDWSYRYKDTLQDTYDKLSTDSVDAVGETVVELLRTWRA